LDGTNGFKISRSLDSRGVDAFYFIELDWNGDGLEDHLFLGMGDSVWGNVTQDLFVLYGGQNYEAEVDLDNLSASEGCWIPPVRSPGGTVLQRSVSILGDINGDGAEDMMVMFQDSGSAASDPLKTMVLFGGADLPAVLNLEGLELDGSNGFWVTGLAGPANSGLGNDRGRDFNGDGIADIIIEAQAAAGSAGNSDSFVIYGSGTGVDSVVDVSDLKGIRGYRVVSPPSETGGTKGAADTDLSGDGVLDMGMIYADGAMQSSEFYLAYGRMAGQAPELRADTLGDRTTHEYDREGNEVRRIEPDGTINEYDSEHRLSGQTLLNGDVYTYYVSGEFTGRAMSFRAFGSDVVEYYEYHSGTGNLYGLLKLDGQGNYIEQNYYRDEQFYGTWPEVTVTGRIEFHHEAGNERTWRYCEYFGDETPDYLLDDTDILRAVEVDLPAYSGQSIRHEYDRDGRSVHNTIPGMGPVKGFDSTIDYYASGNMRSVIYKDLNGTYLSTKTFVDEDFFGGGNGRVFSHERADGSYDTFEYYVAWSVTARIHRRYDAAGQLIDARKYDTQGNEGSFVDSLSAAPIIQSVDIFGASGYFEMMTEKDMELSVTTPEANFESRQPTLTVS
ncbi:MAG: hypothetical protein HQL11_03780, partial [Candidatus Omnitrophica bacterium]|nr:hypothetical protein [Candidatus Omnitrophota bacterium]